MTVSAAEPARLNLDEDACLVRRFLAGDAGAFDRIYARYRDKVYVIAKGILLDPDDAADAVQEAFALIFRNLPRFHQRSRLGTWIFRIAVNTSIQVSRKLKHKGRDVGIEAAMDRAVPEPDEATEADMKIHQALAQLKPADRAVLALFYWEDLSLDEIGEALSCGGNAAKTRLYRARERFRELFESPEETP
ncbi:MAG: sigma-70 family RNA polymerase sigma factor [Armatimonadetes bacterium]|nr:sigma-70 family RNA polymerase sigma factor [Armatimonadota bacterium]